MKRFNVSILAVVAVLAIGLTAFTKAEPAGKRVVRQNCYRNLVATYNAACAASSFTLQPGVACDLALPQVGKGISAIPGSFNALLDCGTTESFFCCAQLIVDPTPCAAQPVIPSFVDASGVTQINQKAQISAVFCKPTAN